MDHHYHPNEEVSLKGEMHKRRFLQNMEKFRRKYEYKRGPVRSSSFDSPRLRNLEVPGIQAKNSLESKIETREARWTRRGSTKDRFKDDKSPRNRVLDLDKKKLH